MKEIIKKYIFLIIITLLFISPIKAYASTSEYVINNYDINIVVNENNTLKITEKIGAYFNVDKHGIFRKIPLRNTVTRLDGTTSKNRAQISEIEVSDNYSVYSENGYKVIKIGDVNYTLTGQKNYTISYLYNLGKDTGKEYDELYFNLIGNEWDTSISNITFTITMPKEFDKSKLGFSSGAVGSTNSSKITYNINGNVITGKLNGSLNPGDAFTVRLELPEGYFVGASLIYNPMDYVQYILPVIFLVISILLWYKYGRDDQVIETVEFYPPEGFNSLEVGFLYKGEADSQDVTSLLIYLANKGYLKIIETEEESKITNFKIVKLKDYDGNNINEALFLNGLFEENEKLEVTFKDLYNKFYKTLDKILENINTKKNKNIILTRKSTSKRKYIILMLCITYCLIIVPPIIETGNYNIIFHAILFPAFGFSILFEALFNNKYEESITYTENGKEKEMDIGKLFLIMFGLVFAGAGLAVIGPVLIISIQYLIGYIVGILCAMGMTICNIYIHKRTPYGNQMLGKLKGFKNFLEVVEKEQLEAMVMKNPSYFYEILPYTYVLNVSDKWISKFESISLKAPSWYSGSNEFNVSNFGTFVSTTMARAQSSMSSGSSSSGSSGGGSSGGGSGGGGGGSW